MSLLSTTSTSAVRVRSVRVRSVRVRSVRVRSVQGSAVDVLEPTMVRGSAVRTYVRHSGPLAHPLRDTVACSSLDSFRDRAESDKRATGSEPVGDAVTFLGPRQTASGKGASAADGASSDSSPDLIRPFQENGSGGG